MKDNFERTVWFVIAAALSVIALNPWISPGLLNAQPEIVKVDIVKLEGKSLSYHRQNLIGLPVRRTFR